MVLFLHLNAPWVAIFKIRYSSLCDSTTVCVCVCPPRHTEASGWQHVLSLPPHVTFNYLELVYASETVHTNHDILCTKRVYEWNRRPTKRAI